MEAIKEYLLSPPFWISIIVLVVAFIVWKVGRIFLRKVLKLKDGKKTQQTNFRVVGTAIKSAYVILVAAVVLQINGINIGTLFTGLGVAGIIVGFALQDILKDLMMGTSIIWDKFFAVGDYICYNGKEWQVIEFNAKVTKLYDFIEDTTITISNRNITEIAKATKIVGVSISAPYDVPLSRIRPVMEEIVCRAKELPSVEDAQFLGTDEFADSSINYKIVLNCVDPSVKGVARRGTLDIVQEVFAEENISIPYPQMDVHMCK